MTRKLKPIFRQFVGYQIKRKCMAIRCPSRVHLTTFLVSLQLRVWPLVREALQWGHWYFLKFLPVRLFSAAVTSSSVAHRLSALRILSCIEFSFVSQKGCRHLSSPLPQRWKDLQMDMPHVLTQYQVVNEKSWTGLRTK